MLISILIVIIIEGHHNDFNLYLLFLCHSYECYFRPNFYCQTSLSFSFIFLSSLLRRKIDWRPLILYALRDVFASRKTSYQNINQVKKKERKKKAAHNLLCVMRYARWRAFHPMHKWVCLSSPDHMSTLPCAWYIRGSILRALEMGLRHSRNFFSIWCLLWNWW